MHFLNNFLFLQESLMALKMKAKDLRFSLIVAARVNQWQHVHSGVLRPPFHLAGRFPIRKPHTAGNGIMITTRPKKHAGYSFDWKVYA